MNGSASQPNISFISCITAKSETCDAVINVDGTGFFEHEPSEACSGMRDG